MTKKEANEDLFKGPDSVHNFKTFNTVTSVVRDVAQNTFQQPAVKNFFNKFQQKLVDYGQKRLDGYLPDSATFAIYERGIILKEYHGPAICEAELEPHQVDILIARLKAEDYPDYKYLERDLPYLKFIPKGKTSHV